VYFGKDFPQIYVNVFVKNEATFTELLECNPPLSSEIADFLPKCWGKEPSSRLSAHRAFEIFRKFAPKSDSLSPLNVPSPHNLSPKPITSYIHALDGKGVLATADINP